MLTDDQKANRAARRERIEVRAAREVANLDVDKLLRRRHFDRIVLTGLLEYLTVVEDDIAEKVFEIVAVQRKLAELGYKED